MNRIVRLAVLSGLALVFMSAFTSILPALLQHSGVAQAQMLTDDPHAKAAARANKAAASKSAASKAAAADRAARMKKSATDGPGMTVLDKDAPLFCRVCHESQDKARAAKKKAPTRSAKKAGTSAQ
jgi:hypothetical protein